MDNKQILETLQMQPLSEDEKKSRHILGRLYGPIATCVESTRNGRKYNRELWLNQLNDDILKEKIENKSLFLELGHPADREETDMEKVCACIPEMPKIVGDDLYAYVDILDTKNGRLLKTLCDYGFVPGISSRGSGDIMDNDEVDPETFFLETWDIVQLPAVKKARLSVCESVDPCKIKLQKALTESYKNSSEEDKKIMKEALDNLNIKIEDESEELTEKIKIIPTPAKEADIPWGIETPEDDTALLVEDADAESSEDTEIEVPEDNTEVDETDITLTDEPDLDIAPIEDDSEETEETEAESEEQEESEEESEDEETEDIEILTVKDVKDLLKSFENDSEIEISNITIDGVEYQAELSVDDDSKDKVIIGVNCTPVETEEAEEEPEIDSEKIADEEEPTEEESNEDKIEDEEADSDDEPAEEKAEEESEEVIDDEAEEVIESLKEAIRQKDALAKEVKTLRNKQTVGDAKVDELKEELNKYKTAFARVSELAGKVTTYEKDVKALQEQLTQKETEIKQLHEQHVSATKLTESVESETRKVQKLTEKLDEVQKNSEDLEKGLREELSQYKQKLAERTSIAKSYRNKATAVLERYISSKASMLGVRPSEIMSKLDENYTVDDIDKVCDDLLDFNVNINSLPFGIDRKSKIQIKESKEVKSNRLDPDNGYEIDDSLLELAGLK